MNNFTLIKFQASKRRLSNLIFKTLLSVVLATASFKSSATIFPAGSVIIDMGSATPTIANTLKGYGLVYSLLKWKSVPINLIINTGKAKDGIDFTLNTTVYGAIPGAITSRSFYAGCYVISAESITASVRTTLDSTQKWASVGKYYTTAAIDLPVSVTLKFAPRWVLNDQNQSISEGFFTDAGIPFSKSVGVFSAVSYKLPAALDDCDDIFVMPHADPTWLKHQNLYTWNQTNKGAIWAGCHAVSVFENISGTISPDPTIRNMNFLSTTPTNNTYTKGVRHYNSDPLGDHGDGSTPYSTAYPTDPVYQYRGTVDGAQEGGSEQIYFPKRSSTWNPWCQIGYLGSNTTYCHR